MYIPKRTNGRLLVCVGYAIVLSLLAAPAAADFTRITTKSAFLELVVAHEFTARETVLQYTDDGKMVGVARGMRIEGTWDWANGALCRTATLGATDLGHDCLVVHVDGDNLILVRNNGLGQAFLLWRVPAGRSRSGESVKEESVEVAFCFC